MVEQVHLLGSYNYICRLQRTIKRHLHWVWQRLVVGWNLTLESTILLSGFEIQFILQLIILIYWIIKIF